MAGPNASRSGPLTPSQRLDEIAEILAAGLMRLGARKSSQLSADCGESSLHISPDQSGRASPAMHMQEDT
jgi:hypothetical protein